MLNKRFMTPLLQLTDCGGDVASHVDFAEADLIYGFSHLRAPLDQIIRARGGAEGGDTTRPLKLESLLLCVFTKGSIEMAISPFPPRWIDCPSDGLQHIRTPLLGDGEIVAFESGK